MYPALDRCVMPALLRCPSRPCHKDDTEISTKNKPPSLSVTYKGYNECTFGPLASRRFPLWSVHPPDCWEWTRPPVRKRSLNNLFWRKNLRMGDVKQHITHTERERGTKRYNSINKNMQQLQMNNHTLYKRLQSHFI